MKHTFLFWFFTALFSGAAFSQPGLNDPAFNASDLGFSNGAGFSGNSAPAIAEQADGKIIIGGEFSHYDGFASNNIVRINPDGTRDATYPGLNLPAVHAITLQPDGKLLVGHDGGFIRLNQNGTIDQTYPGGGTDQAVRALALQPDGKLLIGGFFSSCNGVAAAGVVRLDATGAIDPTFAILYTATVYNIVVQPDGKLLLAGSFSNIPGYPDPVELIRVNSDGTLDAGFELTTSSNGLIGSIALQPDGKIIIGGSFTTYNGMPINTIARLNPDGTIDGSFSSTSGAATFVSHLSLQADGKLIVAQVVNPGSIAQLLRLEPNGTVDNSFATASGNNGSFFGLALLHDGNLLITFDFENYLNSPRSRIARLHADGTVDLSFHPRTGANAGIYSVDVQPDNKLMIGGMFWFYNDVSRGKIARLNPDGSLDPTFDPGVGFDSEVDKLLVQPDGKIVVAGAFSSYNGVGRNKIVRLNPDGSIDNSFNPAAGPDTFGSSGVYLLLLQPDGKLLVGGYFTLFNGVSCYHLIRLNPDGSVDPSFNVQNGANGQLLNMCLQPDGKLLISGSFTLFGSTPKNYLARLNADGTLDAGFMPGTGPNQGVSALTVQPDGKILINGSFTTFDGVLRYKIARLNSDGTLDLTFDPNVAMQEFSTVSSSLCQPDGKIILHGTSPAGVVFKRFLTDGTPDATFATGTGGLEMYGSAIVPAAIDMKFQGSGIIVAGQFNAFNGTGRNNLLRMMTCTPGVSTTNIVTCSEYTWTNGITYSSSGTYTQTLSGSACDSIATLQLTIDTIASNDVQVAYDQYTWIDGNTYTESNNTATVVFQTEAGCDSTVTLDLTILSSSVTAFVGPSMNDTCTGVAYVTINGNSPFTVDIGNGSPVATDSTALFEGLCPGMYTVLVTDALGENMNGMFVIVADSNYILIDPFDEESNIIDSLSVTIENCDIDYATVDTAYIESYNFITEDSLIVSWVVIDAIGTTVIPATYVLNGEGDVYLQLQLYCTQKALGDYFVVTEGVSIHNGSLSTLSISENETAAFLIYPNPSSAVVTIAFSAMTANLCVTDAQGKIVAARAIHNTEQFSMEELESGVYFFELNTASDRIVKRVVKN